MQLRLLSSATAVDDAVYTLPRPERHRSHELSALGGRDGMRFWRPLPRKVMDVICAEGVALEVPLQAHEALLVLLPASRFAVLDGARRATVVRPGVVHVTTPLELHAVRTLDGAPCHMRLLFVAADALAARRDVPASEACPGAPGVTSGAVDDPGLYAELWALFDELRRPLVELECEARLRACLTRLLDRRAEGGRAAADGAGREASGVERARDYLRAHATESVSLDALAGVAGLSKFYLLRAFRDAYGLTPHAYQMQLRLARARRLIGDGRPLSHVTYDAGFADQSHLTRRFAPFFGLTPARYARQLATPPAVAPHPATVFSRTVTRPPAA